MEKNLPFVSVPLAETGYNKFIIPFIGHLDDGNVFKKVITSLLVFAGIVILLGGIYVSIAGIFGSEGYIKTAISIAGLSVGKRIGSSIGLIFGFPISLLTTWILYSIFKKRTEQLNDQEYIGLLDFIFNKTFPKVIIMFGELLFVLVFYAGIMQLVATIVGSYAYAPLTRFPGLVLGILPGMRFFESFIPQQIYGDYHNFVELLTLSLTSLAASFVVLIAFYIYKEVYMYALKLVTVFINFLPKFAFPLAIRKSYLNVHNETGDLTSEIKNENIINQVSSKSGLCPQCGERIENPDDIFCTHCRHKLK